MLLPSKVTILIALCLGLVFSTAKAEIAKSYDLESENPAQSAEFSNKNRISLQRALKRKITGIEIWVAEGSFKQIESIFGHAFLRLLDDDGDPLNDLVITYGMLALNEKMKYSQRASQWPLYPYAMNLIEAVVTYSKLDTRPFRRFIIPSNPVILSRLKLSLLQFAEEPALLGDYDFVNNNCLSGILKTLKAVGYPVTASVLPDVPTLARLNLSVQLMNFYPNDDRLFVKGAADLISRLKYEFSPGMILGPVAERQKKSDERRALDPRWKRSVQAKLSSFLNKDHFQPDYFKTKKFWERIESFSDEDIERLYIFWPTEWASMSSRAAQLYSKRIPVKKNLLDLLSITKLPQSLYQLCAEEDFECRDKRKVDSGEVFGRTAMENHLSHMSAIRSEKFKGLLRLARDPQDMEVFDNFVILNLKNFATDFNGHIYGEEL